MPRLELYRDERERDGVGVRCGLDECDDVMLCIGLVYVYVDVVGYV